MNSKFLFLFVTIFTLLVTDMQAQENTSDFPLLKGPYLGPRPPGKKAELFAPQVIAYEVHESPCFSQDEKEIIIGSMTEGTKCYKMVNGIMGDIK